jgi:hypothetical protein
MRSAATTTSWVDALARLRPREHHKGSGRARTLVPVPTPREEPRPRPGVSREQACAITGAKRVKKKCCRSTPRCKGCPVVLMRAARAAESGLTGKDLAKAVKRARAA